MIPSVSYTHLDVYKRQNTGTANDFALTAADGNGLKALSTLGVLVQSNATDEAVSYTHLDVYKRQPLGVRSFFALVKYL